MIFKKIKEVCFDFLRFFRKNRQGTQLKSIYFSYSKYIIFSKIKLIKQAM
jgi:hypothetical protein